MDGTPAAVGGRRRWRETRRAGAGRGRGTVLAAVAEAMRVALPVFGTELSPRFCFAAEVLIVTQDRPDGVETRPRERLVLEGLGWPDRLRRLAERRVDVLLCGGFPRIFRAQAEALGIRVEVGLGGEAERVLEAFRRNALHEVTSGGRPGGGRPTSRRRGAAARAGRPGAGGSAAF
jgi:predicted Fe-Mo cluster-binding NifX family protein